jgi:hypothetical protein
MREDERRAEIRRPRRARHGVRITTAAGILLLAAAVAGFAPAATAGGPDAAAVAAERQKPKPERSRGTGAANPAGGAAGRQGAADREGSPRTDGTADAGRPDAADRGSSPSQGEATAAGGDRRGTAAATLPDDIAAKLPAPSAAQQQNLVDLRDDLSTLGTGLQGAEDEIRQLASDLQGVSAQPPDPALVESLARDLQAALADSTLSPREAAELSQSVYAVLNSAGLSQQELATLKSDVEAILAASGVGPEEIEAILNDLQAIYDAYQGPSASSAGSRKSAPATEPARRLRDRRP